MASSSISRLDHDSAPLLIGWYKNMDDASDVMMAASSSPSPVVSLTSPRMSSSSLESPFSSAGGVCVTPSRTLPASCCMRPASLKSAWRILARSLTPLPRSDLSE